MNRSQTAIEMVEKFMKYFSGIIKQLKRLNQIKYPR